MLMDLLFRFLIGGAVVSAFSLIGDLLEPKSFAGLFGAAPSVALATLGLTIAHEGPGYASLESRSMVMGGVAFIFCASLFSRLLLKRGWGPGRALTISIGLWFILAFGLWFGMLR